MIFILGYVCTKCGELLAVLNYKELIKNTLITQKNLSVEVNNGPKKPNIKDEFFVDQNVVCKNCGDLNTCVKVAIPYVLRYLTNELAAMNIRLSYTVK
jgi:DNA-directed RNA polymerase I subunit RPA2